MPADVYVCTVAPCQLCCTEVRKLVMRIEVLLLMNVFDGYDGEDRIEDRLRWIPQDGRAINFRTCGWIVKTDEMKDCRRLSQRPLRESEGESSETEQDWSRLTRRPVE